MQRRVSLGDTFSSIADSDKPETRYLRSNLNVRQENSDPLDDLSGTRSFLEYSSITVPRNRNVFLENTPSAIAESEASDTSVLPLSSNIWQERSEDVPRNILENTLSVRNVVAASEASEPSALSPSLNFSQEGPGELHDLSGIESVLEDSVTETEESIQLSPCVLSRKTLERGKKEPETRRQIHLVTYAQADVLKAPSRQKFADIVVKAFEADPGTKVIQWVCGAEIHNQTEGLHYHCAVKLNKKRRIKNLATAIQKEHNFRVNFEPWHTNYYDAYTYVTKQDRAHFVTSENHPPLETKPLTHNATKRVREAAASESKEAGSCPPKQMKKVPRLKLSEIYHLICENNVQDEEELLALAGVQEREGNEKLLSSCMGTTSKQRNEWIKTAWGIKKGPEIQARRKEKLMERLARFKESSCVEGCDGLWLNLATQTLRNNDFEVAQFAANLRNTLTYGRGKLGRNLYIYGVGNCAKTFLFKGMGGKNGDNEVLFDLFSPGSGTFNWIGANKADVIFLNDIRYTEDGVMKWGPFLNLLEGEEIQISLPKNEYAANQKWTKLTPIVATSKYPISYVKNGILDEVDTGMMNKRWKFFHFTHEIPADSLIECPACGKCFASLVLDN